MSNSNNQDLTQTLPSLVNSTMPSRRTTSPPPVPASLAAGLRSHLGSGTQSGSVTTTVAQPTAPLAKAPEVEPPPGDESRTEQAGVLVKSITVEEMLMDTRYSYDLKVIDMRLKTPQACDPSSVIAEFNAIFSIEMGLRTGHPDGLPPAVYLIKWMPPPAGAMKEEGYFIITIPSQLKDIAASVLDLNVIAFQRDEHGNVYRFKWQEHTYRNNRKGPSVADHEDHWCLFYPPPDTRFNMRVHHEAATTALGAVGMIIPPNDPRCFQAGTTKDGERSVGRYHCAWEIDWALIPRDPQWDSIDLSSIKTIKISDGTDEPPEYGRISFDPGRLKKVFGICPRCYKTQAPAGPCKGHDDGKKKERAPAAAVRNVMAMQRMAKRAKATSSQDFSF